MIAQKINPSNRVIPGNKGGIPPKVKDEISNAGIFILFCIIFIKVFLG